MDLTAETPETVAVKAKLMVVRWTLWEANKNKGRVKKQGQGMAIKLKGAREAGRRVLDLEREVAGLREDVAGAQAAAAPPGGRGAPGRPRGGAVQLQQGLQPARRAIS